MFTVDVCKLAEVDVRMFEMMGDVPVFIVEQVSS
jgi:hypothetical protein